MPKIAISYRRSDSSAITGRIFDRLAAHYGKESVFMDIDNIPFGTDFRSHIQAVLQETEVLIVVIGPQWLGSDAAGAIRMSQESGQRRAAAELQGLRIPQRGGSRDRSRFSSPSGSTDRRHRSNRGGARR